MYFIFTFANVGFIVKYKNIEKIYNYISVLFYVTSMLELITTILVASMGDATIFTTIYKS